MRNREWAEEAMRELQSGQTTLVKPKGRSMQGRVSNGDLVSLEPCCVEELAVDDIVLARIKGRRHFHLVLHLIVAREADKFLIGNNHGRIDGWVASEDIFGKVTGVHPSFPASTQSF